ncbi:DUF2255 family protein [soil metagenome]
MTSWTDDELDRIGRADELIVSGTKPDGSLRRGVIIWAVRVDDSVYLRSVRGPDASWFRGTQLAGIGSIEAGGVTKDVTFVRVDDLNDEIDTAYRAKYGSGSAVRSITSDLAASTTLRVDVREGSK